MGNYRFRLSDMIPNAWFYKLKDMGRGRKKYPPSSSSSSSHLKRRPSTSPGYSYHITNQPIQRDKFTNSKSLRTQFPDPSRKSSSSSSKKKTKRKTVYKPSPKHEDGFGSNEKANSAWNRACSIPTYSPDYSSSSLFESPFDPEEDDDHGFVIPESFDRLVSSWASSCKCRVTSSAADIIIDLDEEQHPFARKSDETKGFRSASELDLPPILSKPGKHHRGSSKFEETKPRSSLPEKITENERIKPRKEKAKTTGTSPAPARRPVSNSTGIRLRTNSPRIATRKHQTGTRKSISAARNGPVSESFVVVKSSLDPKRDFRESMVEMIVENNISASKDLEELLACYLSLNSDEYHDLIVKAFEDIWVDMARLRL